MLWERLQIISVEDVGFGRVEAPVVVHASVFHARAVPVAVRATGSFSRRMPSGCLVTSPKDRTTDELGNWISHLVDDEGVRPEIPDVALDVHTRRGQLMGQRARPLPRRGCPGRKRGAGPRSHLPPACAGFARHLGGQGVSLFSQQASEGASVDPESTGRRVRRRHRRGTGGQGLQDRADEPGSAPRHQYEGRARVLHRPARLVGLREVDSAAHPGRPGAALLRVGARRGKPAP